MSIGNFDTNNITRQTSIAMWIAFAVTVILLIWAFVVPPKGDINASVLKACTLIYTIIPFAIAREALKEGKGAKISHGDTNIEIKDYD